MQVKLLNYTPLNICSNAIRTCWQSFEKGDNGGEIDKMLIERVGNKNKHSSTLEHLFYNFYIKGISRACLQELARHRMASLSVKSTRYTLKELKNEKSFIGTNNKISATNLKRAQKFIVFCADNAVNEASIRALENLRVLLAQGISNDTLKYCLVESYKTELAWSINARSLQNFLHLRTSKSALWEIQDLARAVYNALPEEHKYIFKESIYEN